MKISLLFFLLFITFITRAQVGIGTTTPDGSAALEITNANKGLLIPRMASGVRLGISLPATGLVVYQTDAPTGFYYNSGTPGVPVWSFIQNSDNANITLQGNTFNGASQLVQMTAATKLPAVNGSLLTSLNASSLASGTVNTARLGTGTASSGNYLRGDGTWSTPSSGGGVGQTFFNSLTSQAALTVTFSGLTTNVYKTIYSQDGMVMPVACTFDAIYVNAIQLSGPGGVDVLTITLYKNGVATALSATVTTSASLNVLTTANTTGASVSVAAGDILNYGVSHTNSPPLVTLIISGHCY